MAIAGKVATTPGYEWSDSVAYDKLVVVTYNNNVYLSTQPSTDIEPTNTEYWMLLIENVTAEQYEAIVNGTTKVGKASTADSATNASQLGGKSASEYALDADKVNISSIPLGNGTVKYVIFAKISKSIISDYARATLLFSNICNITDSLGSTAYNGVFAVGVSYRRQEIRMTAQALLTGRNYYDTLTFGYYSDDNYVYFGFKTPHYAHAQKVIDLGHSEFEVGFLDKLTEEPSGWTTIDKLDLATTADLANYLPLSGGRVVGNGASPLSVESSNSNDVYIHLFGADGFLGALGFNGANNPAFYNTNWAPFPLLHSGNVGDYAVKKNDIVEQKVSSPVYIPFSIDNTYEGSNGVALGFYLNGVAQGGLSFDNGVADVTEGGVTHRLLHTGNSSPVAIQSVPPSIVSSLWYDTVNNIFKRYIDGAWTVIS